MHGVAVHLRVAEGRQVDRTDALRRRSRGPAASAIGTGSSGRSRSGSRSSADDGGVVLDGDPVHGFSIARIRGAVSTVRDHASMPPVRCRTRVNPARLEPRERGRGTDAEVAEHDRRSSRDRARRAARRAGRAGSSPPPAARRRPPRTARGHRAAPADPATDPPAVSASSRAEIERSDAAARGGARHRGVAVALSRRVARVAHLTARPGQRVEHDHAADERLADAGQELERLRGHEPADHRADARQDAGDLARVGLGVRVRPGRGRGSPCRPTRCRPGPTTAAPSPRRGGCPRRPRRRSRRSASRCCRSRRSGCRRRTAVRRRSRA